MFETTRGGVDIGLSTRNLCKMKKFYTEVLGSRRRRLSRCRRISCARRVLRETA